MQTKHGSVAIISFDNNRKIGLCYNSITQEEMIVFLIALNPFPKGSYREKTIEFNGLDGCSFFPLLECRLG